MTHIKALEIFRGLVSDILRTYKTCAATLCKMGEETLSERDFIKLAVKIGAEMDLFPSAQDITLSSVTVRNALAELAKLKMADTNQIRKKIRRGKVDPAVAF